MHQSSKSAQRKESCNSLHQFCRLWRCIYVNFRAIIRWIIILVDKWSVHNIIFSVIIPCFFWWTVENQELWGICAITPWLCIIILLLPFLYLVSISLSSPSLFSSLAQTRGCWTWDRLVGSSICCKIMRWHYIEIGRALHSINNYYRTYYR